VTLSPAPLPTRRRPGIQRRPERHHGRDQRDLPRRPWCDPGRLQSGGLSWGRCGRGTRSGARACGYAGGRSGESVRRGAQLTGTRERVGATSTSQVTLAGVIGALGGVVVRGQRRRRRRGTGCGSDSRRAYLYAYVGARLPAGPGCDELSAGDVLRARRLAAVAANTARLTDTRNARCCFQADEWSHFLGAGNRASGCLPAQRWRSITGKAERWADTSGPALAITSHTNKSDR